MGQIMLSLALLTTSIVVLPATAQQRRETGHIDDPAAPDSAHFTVSTVREYDSLASLYADSDLVVQGDISRVLPARDVSASPRSHTLMTDIAFNVTHTFKGPALSRIAIAQLGGIQGNRQRIPDQFRMMQKGEQYVLFLKQDPRLQSIELADIPTYSVTGAWAGIFQVVANSLRLSPTTHAGLRDRYEGKPLGGLIADLASAVR